MSAAKKKQLEDDEDDAPQRPRRGGDDEEGSGEQSQGFSPKALIQKAKDWAAENRTLALIFAAVAALLVLIIISLIVWRIISVRNRPTVEQSVLAFEFGAYQQARVYAESVLRYAKENEYEKRSDALFVLGAAMIEQNENNHWGDREAFLLAAANHLKEANAIGFSEELQERGLFYYGKALYLSDDMPRAIEILLQAEESATRNRKEIAWFLADAFTRTETPDFNRALEFSDEFLLDASATQLEKYEGMLLQSNILLGLGRYDEAVDVFNRVPILDELEAFQEFVCARILMEEARELRRRAMKLERDLLLEDSPFEVPREIVPIPTENGTESLEPDVDSSETSETAEDPFRPSLLPEDAGSETGESTAPAPNSAPVPSNTTKILPRMSPRKTNIVQAAFQTPISDSGTTAPSSDELAYADLQNYRTKSLQRYKEAVLRLEMCKNADIMRQRFTREAILLQGVCYEEMGEFTKARDMYREIVKQYPASSEAIAGEFFRAELLRRQGRFETALAGYDRAAKRLRQIEIYVNPWLTRNEIRNRIAQSVESLFELKEFHEAFQMLAVFEGIVPPKDDAAMKADGYERWARVLRQQANASSFEKREQYTDEMRKKYRSSGRWFKTLSQIDEESPNLVEYLWKSAENYRLGKDYVRAIPMYRAYLKNELTYRQAETLATLGQLYFDLDLLDQSVETFDQFFEEYPRHPLVYRARLVKSYAHFELGETSQALVLLLENLSGVLAPQAAEYRDSIYALGRLYYESGDRLKAIETLENATYLHPEAPQAAQAYYMIAQSYLKTVIESQQRMKTTNLVRTREQANLESQNARRSALENFIKAKEQLNRLELEMPLAPSERMMQMICYFEIAKQELALGRNEDALLSFETAQHRFQERPETLDAIIQVARIYRMLGKPQQAGEAITRGKVLLQKLIETKAFPPGYRFNQEEWDELLKWQESL